jgi:branched-chain amino acid transport system ATP-binding protein
MEHLQLRGVCAGYAQADVLNEVDLIAPCDAITCLLGANGAGKTTLIRCVMGLTPLRRGSIEFAGRSLAGRATHAIVAAGIACIPEGRRVFPRLTVQENLRAGAYLERDSRAVDRRFDAVFDLFPRLAERREQLAGTMSGGEQAMLSIGRGLMAQPRLLLIDEPSLGLAPRLVQETFAAIGRIHALGIGVLLVEQNVEQTLALAQRGYVLRQGRVVASGSAGELRQDAEVQRAYFGTGAA